MKKHDKDGEVSDRIVSVRGHCLGPNEIGLGAGLCTYANENGLFILFLPSWISTKNVVKKTTIVKNHTYIAAINDFGEKFILFFWWYNHYFNISAVLLVAHIYLLC